MASLHAASGPVKKKRMIFTDADSGAFNGDAGVKKNGLAEMQKQAGHFLGQTMMRIQVSKGNFRFFDWQIMPF